MVVATMVWRQKPMPKAKTLGILAFDAAKCMSNLVSLYHSLSEVEITKLRNEVIKSKGVAYLNSEKECFLLNLAMAERLEQLDAMANTVSRLAQKCSDYSLSRFDLVYADLKLGLIDLHKLNNSRNINSIINKMERFVSSTTNLLLAMESMTELEASEKKRQPFDTMEITFTNCIYVKPTCEYFNAKISHQRKQVQHCKEVSLWNQTFDKTVGIMAKVICIVYARICLVFEAYVTNCNCCHKGKENDDVFSGFDYNYCLLEHRELYQKTRCLSEEKRVSRSGPITKGDNKTGVIRFLNQNLPLDVNGDKKMNDVSNKVLTLAPRSTVGGVGMAIRYAEVILFMERCLHTPTMVKEETREALYEMLPERVRGKVRAKLRGRWRKGQEEKGEEMAEGWRDAVEELMEWLSPVAHDTMRWQAERHLERTKYETKPTALLLQTLHYSDLEKTEATIVEVLVGLSCMYWCMRS